VILHLDGCVDFDAQSTLTLEPESPATVRVSCAADSNIVDVALRCLATDELVETLCQVGGHDMAYRMAVMRVVFGADDRVSLHLQEWEAAGDDGPEDDGGEPMPVVVPLRRVG
jgi:hypothetical protein